MNQTLSLTYKFPNTEQNLTLALTHGLDRHGEHRHHPQLTINMLLNLALALTYPDSNCRGILPIQILIAEVFCP
ncbi:Neurexin-1 [Manis pentadactyla]|nr:Neurexin-1 [Manis pentadactyla]